MALPSFTRHWLWFGTRGYETWVPMPASGAEMTRSGYESASTYLNGGAGGSSSKSGSKTYSFAWNDALRSELIPIIDFAEGTYDTHDGVNLIYFVEPSAADYNAAPQNWAQCSLAGEDGMPLWWDNRPDLIATAPNQYRYPARTARYKADGPSQKLYVPVPPGYAAWVGAHGSKSGSAGVRVAQVSGDTAATPTVLPMLSVITDQRVNASFPNETGAPGGIEVDMVPTGLLRNLSVNPSFETDLSATQAITGTGVVTLSRASGSKFGSFVARAQWSTATTSAGGGIFQDVPVKAGKTYAFSTFFRSSLVTRLVPSIIWKDAAGNTITTKDGSAIVTTALPSWTVAPTAQVSGLAPAGAVTARFILRSAAGTSYANWGVGSYLEIDGVQVNEGSIAQEFRDGNSTGWEWTGANNVSVSRQSPDIIQLTSIIIQIFPIGVTPPLGGYLSGQGHSGCQFLGAKPKLTVISAALDRVQVSAKLTETGAWL